MERLLQVPWIIAWLRVLCAGRSLHTGSAITSWTNGKWNCNLVCDCQEDTQSAGYEQNLCPLRGRKAGTVLPRNNGFENIHLLKCALSRCPVKDDELLSVCSGFCSSHHLRPPRVLAGSWNSDCVEAEPKLTADTGLSYRGCDALERDWMVLCCQWWSNHWISGFFLF